MIFRTALMDPPWLERGAGKIKRGADRHYPLMKKDDIYVAISRSGAFHPAEHAHLYMWVTNNFLPDGLWLMSSLGFRYVTNVAWAKSRAGLGQYFRGKHELLLFGVQGKGKDPSVYTDRRDIVSLVAADHVKVNGKRVHSAKPPEFHEHIEARSHGPYIEFFARGEPRPGWTAWGDEVSLAHAEA